MALPKKIPVRFGDVFPHGAFALSVEPLNDYEQARAGMADPQERDKDTGERMWVVRVLDHGVAVLLKVYANCIDGQEIIANTSIEQALSTPKVEAAILDGDHAAGDGTGGHAEQARNDEIDDHAEPSWNRRSGGLA